MSEAKKCLAVLSKWASAPALGRAPTPGTGERGSVTNNAVPVKNGLFTMTLDFGPGAFDSSAPAAVLRCTVSFALSKSALLS